MIKNAWECECAVEPDTSHYLYSGLVWKHKPAGGSLERWMEQLLRYTGTLGTSGRKRHGYDSNGVHLAFELGCYTSELYWRVGFGLRAWLENLTICRRLMIGRGNLSVGWAGKPALHWIDWKWEGCDSGCSSPVEVSERYLVDPASSICLSQRLSHACLSTSLTKVKPRMAH